MAQRYVVYSCGEMPSTAVDAPRGNANNSIVLSTHAKDQAPRSLKHYILTQTDQDHGKIVRSTYHDARSRLNPFLSHAAHYRILIDGVPTSFTSMFTGQATPFLSSSDIVNLTHFELFEN